MGTDQNFVGPDGHRIHIFGTDRLRVSNFIGARYTIQSDDFSVGYLTSDRIFPITYYGFIK